MSGAALQIFSAAVVARVVSVVEAGHYFLGFTLATVCSVLMRAGYDLAVTRFVAADVATGERRSALATSQFFLRRYALRSSIACGLLLVLAMLFEIMPGMSGSIPDAYFPFLASVPFVGLAALTGCALQSARRSFLSVTVMFYATNLAVMALAVLPRGWLSAHAFAVAFFIGSVGAAFAGVVAVRRILSAGDDHLPAFFPPPERQSELVRVARENAVAVVGNLALLWAPLGLIGLFSAPEEAARYGVASRSAQVVAFILPALNFVVAPRFAALKALGKFDELRKMLYAAVGLAFVASSAVALPLVLFSEATMSAFGKDYASGSLVFTLLIVAQWINGGAGPVIQFLVMIGRGTIIRNIFASSGVLILALGTALTIRFGAVGAATASLIAVVFMNVLSFVWAMKDARRLGIPGAQPLAATAFNDAT